MAHTILRTRNNHFLLKLLSLLLFVGFLGIEGAKGQIVAWDLYQALGNEASYASTTTDSKLNSGSLVRGNGFTATALGQGFSSTSVNNSTTLATAQTNNEYYQISFSPKTGNTVSLSTIDYKIRRSGTASNTTFQWAYSLTGSSFTAIGSSVTTSNTTASGQVQTQIDVSGISSLQNVGSSTTIYLRLYAWGATNTSATFAIGKSSTSAGTNVIAIGGTTTALPSLSAATLSSALSNTYGTASTGVGFTASGTNLSANITATAQSGYEVSTALSSGYGSSVSVASGTTVYVRHAATKAAATDNGATAVVLSSTGATSVNVTTSASGNAVTGATPPTLTAAAGATVDGTFVVTFSDNLTWRNAISSVTVGGVALPIAAYSVAAGSITFTPSASSLLQTSGNLSIAVVATNYTDATVTQAVAAGVATKLGITTQPTAPASNGTVLATQPVIAIQDQYGNTTTSTASVTATVNAATWTLGGTTTKAGISGTATFTGLTATSLASVTGAYIAFSSGSLTGINSNTFNIPAPVITLTAAGSATVDAAFTVTFTDNTSWRAAITSITVGGTTLSNSAYSISSGQITFTPAASTLLQSSGSKTITVIATGYANSSVNQSIAAGVATQLSITTQPTAPATNGASLGTQPRVAILDQYGNTTTSTANITAAFSGGTYTLGGTTTVAATSGVVTFTGLTAATSGAPLTTATITFTSGSLPSVTSNSFIILGIAPSVTAAVAATVDAPFSMTFTDNSTWRAAITGVTVAGTSLTTGYSTATAGQLVFTPSASNPTTALQTSGTKSFVISATNYPNVTVSQTIGVGAAAKLAITTQPTAPANNGAVLATQPVVAIQDQYGNATTSTASVTAAVGAGTWTLGGTTSVAGVSGTTTFSGLTATSAGLVTGATITFTSTGLTGVTSNTFNIPAPIVIVIADNGTQTTASSVTASTTNLVLQKAAITVSGNAASLTGMTCTTTGTYASADITNLKVWYQTTATFTGTGTLLSTFTTPGTAALKTFPSFATQSIPVGTGYIFITATTAATVTGGNTIAINGLTSSNFTYTSGSQSGSTSACGTQTLLSTNNWIGAGSATNGAGTDFNTGSNWSLGTVPTANNAAVITFTISSSTPTITFSSATTTVGALSIMDNTASGSTRTRTLSVAANTLVVNGNFNITNACTGTSATTDVVSVASGGTLTVGGNFTATNSNTSNASNIIQIINSGTMTVTGGTTANSLNTGTSSQVVFYVANSATTTFTGNAIFDDGSTVTGNNIYLAATLATTTGTFKFLGNVTWGPTAATSSTFVPSTYLFDGTGTQTWTNNSSQMTTLSSITIGSSNTPTVNFSGTGLTLNSTNTASVVSNLTVSAGATLDLGSSYINRGTGTNASGALTVAGTLKLGSNIGGQSGSNFPSGFSSNTLTSGTVAYYASGSQTVYATPTYGNLTIGDATATPATNALFGSNITTNGNVIINTNATLDATNAFSYSLSVGGNFSNSGTFTARTGTVTFSASTAVTQTISGTTTFYNITKNGANSTLSFGSSTTTIANNLSVSAGTMDGSTSTIIFTGTSGSLTGTTAKNFYNLQINSLAQLTQTAGTSVTVANSYQNNGTFIQDATRTITFKTASALALSGSGSSTFGNVTINSGTTLSPGSHSFTVLGTWTNSGGYTKGTETVTFNGTALSITGNSTAFNVIFIPSGKSIALGVNITATTLTLGSLGTASGTWGSTLSTATYKNATYFGSTATGIITVSNNTALTTTISGVTTSQSVTYGTASISLSGTVASGTNYPATTETVAVTINGTTQNATIGANGAFSVSYTTNTIPYSPTPYTITYAYSSNGFLNATTETTTTLTVNKATVTITPDASQSKVYGTSDPTYTYVASPSVSITGVLARTVGENVNTYAYNLGTLSAGSNYSLSLAGSNTFAITPAALTITGLTGVDKTYDGTTTASAIGTAALSGVVAADASNVILGGTPIYNFTQSSIGTGLTINTTGYTISGTASGNYSLTQPSLTANIIGYTAAAATDYRSNATGNFNTPATWQFDQGGGSWVTSTLVPVGKNITIQNGHTITQDIDYTVASGKTFTIASGGSLIISPTSTLTVAGTANFGGQSVTLQSTSATNGGAIGTITGTLTGATNVTVQRYSQAQRGYRTFGHPFTSATLAELTDNFQITGLTSGSLGNFGLSTGNASAFYYNPLAAKTPTYVNPLTAITNGNYNWGVGQGLYVFVRGAGSEGTGGSYASSGGVPSVVLVDAKNGTINQGPVTVSLGYNANGDNYNLIGNPYPSPINLKNILVKKDSDGTPQSLNSFLSSSTVYTYNPAYSVGSQTILRGGFNTSTHDGIADIIIPTMGAFYVKAPAAGYSIYFQESDKVSTTPSLGLFGTGITNPKVRLAISNTAGFMDEVKLVFDKNASSVSTDKYDAVKFSNSLLDFYTLSSDRKALAIDYRDILNSIIPLGVQTNLANTYTISLSELTNLPNTQLVLRDKLLKTETILSNVGDSYSFNITADTATKGENRFEIGLLGTTVLPVQIADITAQLQANKTVAVNWTSATEINLANYHVQRSKDGTSFNTVGTVAAKGAGAYSFNDDLSTVGTLPSTIYYRLEAVDKNGSKTYSKVVAVLLGSSQAKAAISIYPNPVQSTLYAQVTVSKAGAAQLRVIDAQGKAIITQKTQLAQGTTSLSIPAIQLTNGSYVLEIESAEGKQQQRFVKE